jgi:hypothetical protein
MLMWFRSVTSTVGQTTTTVAIGTIATPTGDATTTDTHTANTIATDGATIEDIGDTMIAVPDTAVIMTAFGIQPPLSLWALSSGGLSTGRQPISTS